MKSTGVRGVSPRMAAAMMSAMMSLAVLAAAGCGSSAPGAHWDLVPVEGVVTLDGQPLAGAEVSFYFQGRAPDGYVGSSAVTDAEGKFALAAGQRRGAVPGTYKVTISRLTTADGSALQLTAGESDGMDLQQMMMQGMVRESLPPRFSHPDRTELTVVIQEDNTSYDLALQSQGRSGA